MGRWFIKKVAFELSNLLFKGQKFVVPSLNVATKTNLVLIPFLIMLQHRKIVSRHIFFKSIKT